MSDLTGKTDDELIQIISTNAKYPAEFLRHMESSLPLEELAVMSKKETGSLYKIQLPICFAVTSIPFGLLTIGKMKPVNTTFKFLGFGISGILCAKVALFSMMHSEASKQFPNGTVANMGKGKFISNVIFRGRNIYGNGWTDKKIPEDL